MTTVHYKCEDASGFHHNCSICEAHEFRGDPIPPAHIAIDWPQGAVPVFAPASQTLLMDRFPDPAMARCLSPNGRSHWASKRKAREYVAQHVWYCARMQGLEPMEGMVTMWPTFVYPVVRKRDDDNLATGIMKSVRDQLVRRKFIVADDVEHLRHMPVEVRVEKGRRALELRFEVGE